MGGRHHGFGGHSLIFDFFIGMCHYMSARITMNRQKIEKWRIKELASVLHNLSELLRKGDNSEWANVFHHFHSECQKIITHPEFDFDSLKRLIQNIKNCFLDMSSLRNLELRHTDSEENMKINRDWQHGRAHLIEVLQDMENRSIEYIN
ncbi:MAG: hypothetical protein ACLFVG_06235 [Candidatus Aminicenantes bacterium]